MRGFTGSMVAVLGAFAVLAPPAGASAAAATLPGIAYLTATSTQDFVWIANADGKAAHRLGVGDGPLLAPNGGTVAASDPTGPHSLVLYSTTGGASGQFFGPNVDAVPLAWSPDSRYLAVGLTGDGASVAGSGLAIIDRSTGTAKVIAHGQIGGASFAPGTSDEIVYAHTSSTSLNAATNIFTASPTGAGIHAITHDGRSLNPVWGARGIAFDRETARRQDSPVYQIWTMRSNGTHRHQVTHSRPPVLAEGLVPVAWSADGTRLLAEYEQEDDGDLAYAVDTATSRVKQLLIDGRSVLAAGISQSGRSVLVESGGEEGPLSGHTVESVPFFGGHATALIRHAAQASWNL
jgi:hypothetical protein